MSSRIRRAAFAIALFNFICVFSAHPGPRALQARAKSPGSPRPQTSEAPRNLCKPSVAAFDDLPGSSQWNGWGADAAQRRFQTSERAGLRADAVPRLKLKWALGFPGASIAFGQPTVAGKRVFAGSADGTVYALGADTGCLYWTFKAGAPVRTAISVGKAGNVWAISGTTKP